MTKIIKILLFVLAIGSFAQNTALAGSNRSVLSDIDGVASTIAEENFVSAVQQSPTIRLAQYSGGRISPSAALRAAKRTAPGSQGLGVRYMPRLRGYVVTLKTRGRIRRVFVDARTGRVRR